MQSTLVFSAVWLCGAAVFSQHYQGAYDRYAPDDVPLPGRLAPAAYGLNYAQGFSEFQPLVPTNFINMDYRFARPPKFYYESTLYGRPYAPFEFPAGRGYYQPPPPSLPYGWIVSETLPGIPLVSYSSHETPRSGALPHVRPGTFPGSEHDYYPASYHDNRPYRGREPPQVYETPPLDHQPSPPLNPSTSPNIIRDDETSSVGNFIPADVEDDRARPFQPTEPRYETKFATDSPQLVTTLLAPTSLEGSSYTRPFSAGYFVPSLFDNRPSEPSSGVLPIFSTSENPNIVRGETSPVPSTTVPNSIGSTGYPGRGVSERPIFSPERTLVNSLIPVSPTEPPSYGTKSPDGGLFSPKMFTPSLRPVSPESSPDREYTQPNILFEAPGHDQPK